MNRREALAAAAAGLGSLVGVPDAFGIEFRRFGRWRRRRQQRQLDTGEGPTRDARNYVPQNGDVVTLENMATQYWVNTFLGRRQDQTWLALRVLPENDPSIAIQMFRVNNAWNFRNWHTGARLYKYDMRYRWTSDTTVPSARIGIRRYDSGLLSFRCWDPGAEYGFSWRPSTYNQESTIVAGWLDAFDFQVRNWIWYPRLIHRPNT